MFWLGSLMSQVLQWTQFWALMTKTSASDRAVAVRRPIRRRRPGNSGSTARRRRRAPSALQRRVLDLQVDRLIFLVIGVGQEHRGQPVEGQHAVRLRIVDLAGAGGRFERLRVGLAVLERAEQREAEQRVRPHVETAEADADDGAEARPQRLDVADLLEVLADVSCRASCPHRRSVRRWRGPRRWPRRMARRPACRTARRCGCP